MAMIRIIPGVYELGLGKGYAAPTLSIKWFRKA